MKLKTTMTTPLVLFLALMAPSAQGFTPSTLPTNIHRHHARSLPSAAVRPASSQMWATPEETDNEIERLRSMAAKLRAEAATLEAEQQQTMANVVAKAFGKLDTNNDGQISLQELKAGLEKEFKMELSEKRVKELMDAFDKSGDGALQLDEFVGMDQLRNRLDALAREEKALALEKAKAAKMEQEAVQFLQAQLEMINDKAPTNSDKLLSCLPYLFPLLDGLQFARFLVMGNLENPVAVAIGIVYALYRAIPFGGLIAFFTLSFLSNNPSINRLIRYNMQQAIYLDIALFFPGLIAAVISLISPGNIPPVFAELGNDALFFSMLAAVGYSTVSSLLGQEPNKIPVISQAVESRMPTVDMFDSEGRFLPRNQQKDDSDDDNDKKDS